MPIAADIPIVEQIARALKTRLEAVSLDYDETHTVVEVIRPTRNGTWTPLNRQIILTQDGLERVPELDCPGSPAGTAWKVRFNIRCHLLPSESATEPLDQEINFFMAGVHRAVTDATAWETFGGLSILADWDSQEKIFNDGGVAGINQPLIVTYRVSETSDYEVRS